MINVDSLTSSVFGREVSYYGVSRIPFWFGSDKSLGYSIYDLLNNETIDITQLDFKKMIKLAINPNNIQITPTIRIANAKTAGGRVYYNWVDKDGRAIEAYEMTCSGVTGNLFPGSPDAARKLYIWMKLRELTLEPRVRKTTVNSEETITQSGLWTGATSVITRTKEVINDSFIIARTVGLPTPIIFIGHYSVPIPFIENADNQYNHSWNFTFVIKDMYPRYEELSSHVSLTTIPALIARVFGF